MKSMTQRLSRINGHILWIALAVSSAIALQAQDLPATPKDRPPHERADITHSGGTVESSANNGRPLGETVLALSEEYGWQVDYEDPVYDPGSEIVDADDPATRALHPDRRIMIPNGGIFHARYAEPTGSNRELSELHVLQAVVAAYNQTDNPGRFFLENEPSGRIAVVGVSKSVGMTPEHQDDTFLSTKISLPIAKRTLGETVEAILDAVIERTRIRAQIGTGPTPRVMQGDVVTVGGSNVAARDLLRQSLDQTGRTWLWSMLYEPTYGTYFFNIRGVTVAVVDSNGRRHLESVDPKPEHPPNTANHP